MTAGLNGKRRVPSMRIGGAAILVGVPIPAMGFATLL